ncbi:MAG: hypothetical protein M3400_15755 [Actinomycetota bacterium]|nr:hypothetical protein [Actinomycetota bacterium]
MSTTKSSPSRKVRTKLRSSTLKRVAGASLVLGGLLNGLPQYLSGFFTGDLDGLSEQIAWSVDNPGIHQAEQLSLLVSSLFLPIGLLGLAWVAHHNARRLTAVATVLVVWGMWGFHNILAMGYTAGTVGPGAVGVDDAVRLNEALIDDGAIIATALFPHLIGSFVGLLLLSVACWRSGAFPKTPLLLMVAFLVWDFVAPVTFGPFRAHMLLVMSCVWLGAHLLRMPTDVWAGKRAIPLRSAARPRGIGHAGEEEVGGSADVGGHPDAGPSGPAQMEEVLAVDSSTVTTSKTRRSGPEADPGASAVRRVAGS